jgi:hypothetical protein
MRTKSLKLLTTVAVSTGPRGAAPTNAATEVATPTIVRTPLLSSWT